MQEAYYCYSRWGAKAKTDDLEIRYPELLRPILQQSDQSVTLLSTLATIGSPDYSIHSSTHKSSMSSNINATLDFAAILKASQTLSMTIQLDDLLYQLTQIILQNSGADRCALILPNEQGEWFVRAIATPDENELCSEPLDNNPRLPVKLIQYVKNTQEVVMIDDLKTALPVIDDHLIQQQPKSVLCLPILNHGNLIGILYLTNRFTSGVFTRDCLLVLNFLCTQSAISINNARLYTRLHQNKTQLQNLANNFPGIIYRFSMNDRGDASFPFMSNRARDLFEVDPDEVKHNAHLIISQIDATDSLSFQSAVSSSMQTLQSFTWVGRFNLTSGHQKWIEAHSIPELQADGSVIWDGVILDVSDRKLAEQELQQAQLQIVQSEKMSALGNLIAGVAHEINNPIGCISGNVGVAQDYINNLLGLIDLYQAELPKPSPKIVDELETIDLEYLREDLPKLIKAMKDGGDRIKSISKSLRTFARSDSDIPQKFNVHDGIESTVLILRHRFKANSQRPEIEIITDYSKLPEINCFPGQLNQVFMNILANAIDALDESNNGRSFAEIKVNPNWITIQTSIENETVKITIADNGKGMSESVKQKIFKHLFTTKAAGKGTGLGLAIARQIVVEKHKGSLEVQSELGQGTEFCIRLPIHPK